MRPSLTVYFHTMKRNPFRSLAAIPTKWTSNGSKSGETFTTYLLFADDTMFSVKTDSDSFLAFADILQTYEAATGQKLNTAKSSISFSAKTPQRTCLSVHYILGIANEGGVRKYLGLTEHVGRRKKLFTSIVDRIKLKANS